MNIIAKCGCRVFQTIFKLAIPILPYRSPQVLTHIEEIPNVLKEQNITSVLVVTDGFLHLSGMLEPLKKALSESKISYAIYDEVVSNPTILNVEMARERYIENHCQGLIGFGGGSAIDCAIHLATSDTLCQGCLRNFFGLFKIFFAIIQNKPLNLVAHGFLARFAEMQLDAISGLADFLYYDGLRVGLYGQRGNGCGGADVGLGCIVFSCHINSFQR